MAGITLTIDVDDRGTVRVKQFADESKKAFDQMQAGPKAAQGPLADLKESWIGITAKIAIATAAFYAAKRMIYDTAKQIASATNDIERQANVLGIGTDQLQKWQYAAKMSDVNAQEFAIGLKMLSRNMEDASAGAGDTARYFSAMGISVKTTQGHLRPLNDVMGDIMDKFASWEDGPRKIAIAMQLFGRSGETLIPLLNKGKTGFNEFAEEARKLGIIVGKDLVEAGSKMEDQFKRIEARVDSLKMKLVVTVWENFFNIEKQMERMKKEYGERIFVPEIGPPETRFKLPTIPKAPPPGIGEKPKEDPWNALIQKAAEYGKAMSDFENVTLGFDLALSSTAITLEQYKEKMKFVRDEEAFWNDITQEAIKLSGELGSYDLSTSVYGTSLEGISGIWKTNFNESKKYWDEQISEALKASEGLRSYDEALSVSGTNTAGYWKIQEIIFKRETSEWEGVWESVGQNISSAWASNMVNIVRSTEGTSAKIKSFFQSIGDVFLSTVSKMITQWLIFGSVTGKKETDGGWLSGGLWSGLLGSILKLKEGGVISGWQPIANIPSFASGTVVRGPTLGIIGDNDERAEAVIPLKGGKIPVEMGKKGGDTYVNNTYIQATDVDSFARRYGGVIESIYFKGKRFNKMSMRQ